MTTAAKIEFKAAAQFNPVFRPVNEWRGRYRILKGSAGSGKSVNIAQDYIAKLSDPAYTGANLLVVRKIEETNRDSTFAELQAAIYGKITIRFARWKRCQVDEHEIQRESDQVDRGNPGHSQRPNGPGDRENDHSEMLRREGAFEHER